MFKVKNIAGVCNVCGEYVDSEGSYYYCKKHNQPRKKVLQKVKELLIKLIPWKNKLK